MDLQQLKQCLLAAGVPEGEYLLMGLDPPRAVREGACIVRPNQRSWEVLRLAARPPGASLTFLNEEEACEYLSTCSLRPTPGRRAAAPTGPVAAGPLPASPATASPVATAP